MALYARAGPCMPACAGVSIFKVRGTGRSPASDLRIKCDQVFQESVVDIVNPPVNVEDPARSFQAFCTIGVLQTLVTCSLTFSSHKASSLSCLSSPSSLPGIKAVHIPDMTKPVIDQAMILILHRRHDSTAAIMTTDDNVLDLEDFHGEVNNRKTIQVGVDHDIGNITVDKYLTRWQVDNLVGRNPAV